MAVSAHRGIVLTLDGVMHEPDEPFLHHDDVAAVRGDGVFETLLVRNGKALKARAHLDRLRRSASMLDLPEPNDAVWWSAIERAAMLFGEANGVDAEGALRLVYSRGRESDPTPTTYVMVSGLPARVEQVRANGVSVITLDRGYGSDVAQKAPWLLLGAKTLSYAVNLAAIRYAESQGVDDVVFTASDGHVLEAPRSTVLLARGKHLLTPPDDAGILPGTTIKAMFAAASDHGFTTEVAPLYPADLVSADGLWLVSSITLLAHVTSLDGFPLRQPAQHDAVWQLINDAITR